MKIIYNGCMEILQQGDDTDTDIKYVDPGFCPHCQKSAIELEKEIERKMRFEKEAVKQIRR